jgi:vacuolar protein sorting-associated protein 13A/C
LKKAQQGWGISSWFYGNNEGSNPAQDGDDDLVITEEQKQEFYQVIDYNEDRAAIAASVDLPKDVS